MPTARKNHVSLAATPYYHCIGRCVRRAFLWGKDAHTGQDFSHRKEWVTERLAELSRSFAVNICAYANHTRQTTQDTHLKTLIFSHNHLSYSDQFF